MKKTTTKKQAPSKSHKPNPTGLLRVSEVVRRTGKARSTVYNWIATKKVKAKKIGTEVYVTIASLREFYGDGAKDLGIEI